MNHKIEFRYSGREKIPQDVTHLYCFGQLFHLPSLPSNLIYLNCNNNQLTTLPPLPPTLTILHCSNNQLTTLPPLPSTLTILYCYGNTQLFEKYQSYNLEEIRKKQAEDNFDWFIK
jgi:Leucine-rich repeat (LRR) protein